MIIELSIWNNTRNTDRIFVVFICIIYKLHTVIYLKIQKNRDQMISILYITISLSYLESPKFDFSHRQITFRWLIQKV
ncbi:hypothetical protein D1872_37050 [compost metagenome]